VSSRVQTAVTMQRVSMNIGEVVKGMDIAMNAMDLDKVREYWGRFCAPEISLTL
jgi:division protein CdvB (Snf7/Vps24/ESCRT-III family)